MWKISYNNQYPRIVKTIDVEQNLERRRKGKGKGKTERWWEKEKR